MDVRHWRLFVFLPFFFGSFMIFMMVSWWSWQFKGYPCVEALDSWERALSAKMARLSWFILVSGANFCCTSFNIIENNKRQQSVKGVFQDLRNTNFYMIYIYIYNIRIYIYRCFKMNQSLMISPCIHHIRTPKFWRSERQMIGALKIPVGRHLAYGQGCGCRLSYPHGCVVKF